MKARKLLTALCAAFAARHGAVTRWVVASAVVFFVSFLTLARASQAGPTSGPASAAERSQDQGKQHEEKHSGEDETSSGSHTHSSVDEHLAGWDHFVSWVGKFHPMLVHFPIALLIAAATAELFTLLGIVLWAANAARFCILLGAPSAIVTALLGWSRASSGDFSTDLAQTVMLHRWFGVGVVVCTTLAAVSSELAWRRSSNPWRVQYRCLLFAGTALVAVTGHLGAVITHGPNYYTW